MIRRVISGWSRRTLLAVGTAGLAVAGLTLGLVVSLGGGSPRTAMASGVLPGTSTAVPTTGFPDSTVGSSTTTAAGSTEPSTTSTPVGARQATNSSSRTTLPASHWADRSPPAGTVSGIWAITCLNQQDCWLLGGSGVAGEGRLLYTTDSGFHWSEVALTANFTSISCIDVTTCWIAGANNAGYPVLAKTTDGGRSWVSSTAPSNSAKTTGSGSGIVCTDGQHCVAVWYEYPPFAAYTDDGGDSWRSGAITTQSSQQTLRAVSCVSASTCYGLEDHAVLESTDGGETWDTTQPLGEYYYTQGMGAMSCVAQGSCLAVGSGMTHSSYPVAYTNSGTSSWHRLTAPQNLLGLDGIICLDPQDCMASGPGWNQSLVITTTDGGTTWQTSPLPNYVPSSSGGNTGVSAFVSCISSTTCWAATTNGHVYQTNTFGR